MKKRLLKVISILISMFVILIGYYFLNKNYHFTIPCFFHELTGLYCPGCGITRLIFSLLEGNISDAYNYNRLVFILLPFIFVYSIYNVYLYIYNKEDKLMCIIPNYVIYMLLFVVVVFGVLRNISAFSYLAP